MTPEMALGILLAHFVGDYLAQSDWMARMKTSRWFPAIVHALTYTACYLVVTRSIPALVVIGGTHAVIDRYRLARHVVYAKNFLAPAHEWPPSWEECKATGYDPTRPPWMTVWLMIIADNTIHMVINALSVMYLG